MAFVWWIQIPSSLFDLMFLLDGPNIHVFNSQHRQLRDSILMILISWFWYSWFWSHGLCCWSWCSCIQFSMLTFHNLMILIDGLDAHDLNFIALIDFFKFSHVLFSMSKIYSFSPLFSIQWSRLMVWFSCCQLLMLIGHDFNFIILVDGHDVHVFNF